MNNKAGFLLLSFLLYLFLSSLLLCCVFTVTTQVLMPTLQSLRRNKELLGLYIASDAFVRDVRMDEIQSFKCSEVERVVWNSGEKDIGWRCKNNRLERVEGIYDDGRWKKKRTSVVGVGVSTIEFHYDYEDGVIVGIQCHVTGTACLQKNVESYVAVRYEEKDAKVLS